MEKVLELDEAIEFSGKDQLIYDLLFSTQSIYNIDLQHYCNFDNRSKFREEIRIIIKRSGLRIIDDRIIHTNAKIIWKIELKK